MTRYKNLNRNSSIVGFEIFSSHIDVLFNDRSLYRYDYHITGIEHVEEMKALAERGCGLCGYIQRFVRKRYAKKSVSFAHINFIGA